MKKLMFYVWALTRPKVVRKLCFKLPIFHYYTLESTGQTAIIQAYDEDGTIRAYCYYGYIGPMLGYDVYGLNPDDFKRISK